MVLLSHAGEHCSVNHHKNAIILFWRLGFSSGHVATVVAILNVKSSRNTCGVEELYH